MFRGITKCFVSRQFILELNIDYGNTFRVLDLCLNKWLEKPTQIKGGYK
jgi:hypothetical protein